MMILQFTHEQQVEFARRVRLFREMRGWTRGRLALEMDVSRSSVDKYEGAFKPTVEFVLKFAALEDELERNGVEMPTSWT